MPDPWTVNLEGSWALGIVSEGGSGDNAQGSDLTLLATSFLHRPAVWPWGGDLTSLSPRTGLPDNQTNQLVKLELTSQ